jgi:hypothetical protein
LLLPLRVALCGSPGRGYLICHSHSSGEVRRSRHRRNNPRPDHSSAIDRCQYLQHSGGVEIGEISSQFGQLLTDELTAEGFSDLFSKMAGQLGKKGLKKLTTGESKLYGGYYYLASSLFFAGTD